MEELERWSMPERRPDPRDRVKCAECGEVFANLAELDAHPCAREDGAEAVCRAAHAYPVEVYCSREYCYRGALAACGHDAPSCVMHGDQHTCGLCGIDSIEHWNGAHGGEEWRKSSEVRKGGGA